MTETTDTEASEVVEDTSTTDLHDEGDTPEGDISDATPAEAEPDVFTREYVQALRRENGKHRQRATEADTLAARLHTELVRATGRLADPADLPFDAEHLDDADKLAAAVDELLAAKPHLASRTPRGDIGQGNRGTASEPFSLLAALKGLA